MTHVFKHPSYYKRIRAANKDQAISKESSTEENQRAPDPDPQASSHKRQAPSDSRCKQQAASSKQQASSFKPQAARSLIQDPS